MTKYNVISIVVTCKNVTIKLLEKNKIKNRILKKTAQCGLSTASTIFYAQAEKIKVQNIV